MDENILLKNGVVVCQYKQWKEENKKKKRTTANRKTPPEEGEGSASKYKEWLGEDKRFYLKEELLTVGEVSEITGSTSIVGDIGREMENVISDAPVVPDNTEKWQKGQCGEGSQNSTEKSEFGRKEVEYLTL